MTDITKALADARDALVIYRRYGALLCGYAANAIDALDDRLAALDAAQPVAWMTAGGDVSRSYAWAAERCMGTDPLPLYLAPQALPVAADAWAEGYKARRARRAH